VEELIATAENPIPPGATVAVVRTVDDRKLRIARFPALAERPRGTIGLFQGRAEFIEKYFETINGLRSRDFEVVTLDWRGQGGSERELANPRKGHIDDFIHYQRDLDAFIATMTSFSCPQPWFGVAHSMGGAILLEATHSGRCPFQRLVLSAPMIDIARLTFPQGARLLADTLDMIGLGAMFIPGGGGASLCEMPFEGNRLTSDRARFERNAGVLRAAPHIGIGDPTIGWVNAAFRQMARFMSPEFSRRSRSPALLLGCGRDEIVSTPAAELFARRFDLATLAIVPGARHELLMERDELREQFWVAFDAFILAAEAPVS
jgi:lysophospholipase